MSTQKRERSRLAYILPDPTVTSGECVLQGITSDGVIDWEHVCHLWVFPVNNDNGVAYAPCVVFLDNSWAMIGPIGTLEAARQLCFRWSALHDRGVCDQTRPAAPAPVVRTGRLVDVPPSELPNTLPGDPWTFNEHQNRFQLDLLQLGIGIANEAEGITLEDRIAQVDGKIAGDQQLLSRKRCYPAPSGQGLYCQSARSRSVLGNRGTGHRGCRS